MERNKVLVKIKGRGPFDGASREEFIDKLRCSLTGRVQAAYLFGSAGSGNYTDESDVDIILIKETGTPFLNRAREFDDIWDLAPAIDLLVYTLAEFEKLLQENVGFWKSVKETLVRVL